MKFFREGLRELISTLGAVFLSSAVLGVMAFILLWVGFRKEYMENREIGNRGEDFESYLINYYVFDRGIRYLDDDALDAFDDWAEYQGMDKIIELADEWHKDECKKRERKSIDGFIHTCIKNSNLFDREKYFLYELAEEYLQEREEGKTECL